MDGENDYGDAIDGNSIVFNRLNYYGQSCTNIVKNVTFTSFIVKEFNLVYLRTQDTQNSIYEDIKFHNIEFRKSSITHVSFGVGSLNIKNMIVKNCTVHNVEILTGNLNNLNISSIELVDLVVIDLLNTALFDVTIIGTFNMDNLMIRSSEGG